MFKIKVFTKPTKIPLEIMYANPQTILFDFSANNAKFKQKHFVWRYIAPNISH
jgi:hypothetical protein